jgi:hypothetical protein
LKEKRRDQCRGSSDLASSVSAFCSDPTGTESLCSKHNRRETPCWLEYWDNSDGIATSYDCVEPKFSITSAIYGVKIEQRFSLLKPEKNKSDYSNLPCELLTSSQIRGIQIGEISKLGWLIGLVKHAICADSLYFLYLL